MSEIYLHRHFQKVNLMFKSLKIHTLIAIKQYHSLIHETGKIFQSPSRGSKYASKWPDYNLYIELLHYIESVRTALLKALYILQRICYGF